VFCEKGFGPDAQLESNAISNAMNINGHCLTLRNNKFQNEVWVRPVSEVIQKPDHS
jgi:hypothetical protein